MLLLDVIKPGRKSQVNKNMCDFEEENHSSVISPISCYVTEMDGEEEEDKA